MLKLRDYQSEAITAVRQAWAGGVRRAAVVLPTGAGKTVVFAHLTAVMHERGVKTLILAHRDELIGQAAAKLRAVAPDLRVGVYKADRREVRGRDVIVASVQSLARQARRDELARAGIRLVIVDEAHHAVSNTYMAVLRDLGCFEADPLQGAYALGVTATLGRADRVALGQVWEDVVYQRSIVQMIRQGYLVNAKGIRVKVDGLDLSKVARSRGDWRDGALAEAMEAALAPKAVARAYVEHAAERQGILFAPTVAMAHEMAEALQCEGVTAEGIDGAMPLLERRRLLARYARGEVQVLSNCMVLCLDEETEILTDAGWVGIDEMTERHRVANWDQGRVFFTEPQEVVARPRGPEERMYVLETPRRSVRVTSRHRMLYRTSRTGPYLKAPVDDLAGRRVALPTSGVADPLERSPLTLDEARLVGFWLGDGSLSRKPRGGVEYTLSQSVTYPKIIQWVDALLERVGVDRVRRDNGHYTVPHVRWSLPRGTGGKSQARRGVRHLEVYLDKAGSPFLWNLDRDQFDALLEGLWYADGNHGQADAGRPRSFVIYGRLALLEALQAIASVRGWTASLRRETAPRGVGHVQVYRLSFNSRGEHKMGRPGDTIRLEQEPWREERVWCVKTDTRNIITRRRGSVTVMGNTEGFDAPWCSAVVIARPTSSAPLYIQMAGRALRPHPGKRDALIMDVVGVTGRHKLASVIDLAGADRVEALADDLAAYEEADELDLLGLLEPAAPGGGFADPGVDGPLVAEVVDLFGASRQAWLRTRKGVWFLSAGDCFVFLTPGSEPGVYSVARCPAKTTGGEFLRTDVDLDMAMSWGEQHANANDAGVLTRRKAGWRDRAPSQGQLNIAARLGLPVDGVTLRGELSDAISRVFASDRIDPMPCVASVKERGYW